MSKKKIYDYFVYNGVHYGVGTEIEITDALFENYKKCCRKPHLNNQMCFINRTQTYNNNNTLTIKTIYGTLWTIPENQGYIKRIIKGVPYHKRTNSEIAYDNWSNNKGRPDIFNGSCWFVILLILSLFVKGALIAMSIVTIWFLMYLINKYNF